MTGRNPSRAEAMGAVIAQQVRSAIGSSLEPLLRRLDELEAKGVKLDELEGTVNGVGELLKGAVAAINEAGGEIEERLDAVERELKAAPEKLAAAVGAIPLLKGDKGDKGEPGAPATDAMIDASGALVMVFADGTTKAVGRVVGKDGEDGAPGLGFDDLRLEFDGERRLKFIWERGAQRHEEEIVAPWIIDRGVYREKTKYERGDAVTWGGSLWVAQKDTETKPGTDDTWRLAAKKGNDGKDAKGA